jgi:hypothetical protein
VTPQYFRECLPSVSPRHFDSSTAAGIAQPHVSDIEMQRADQDVSESGGDGRRLPAYPRGRNSGKGHEIPQPYSQPPDFNFRICDHRSDH